MNKSATAIATASAITVICLANAIADGGGETTPPCFCTEWMINLGTAQFPNMQFRTACILANYGGLNADEFYCKIMTVADGLCPTTKKCGTGGGNDEDNYDRNCTISTRLRAEGTCYGDPYNFTWTSRCREQKGGCVGEQ